MRMIVEAFKETLELGLEEAGQIVVRIGDVIIAGQNCSRATAALPATDACVCSP